MSAKRPKKPQKPGKKSAAAKTARARAARHDKTNAGRREFLKREVVELRVRQRKTFGDISVQLGQSIGHVHALFEEALAEEQGETRAMAGRYKSEQLAGLDAMKARVMPLLLNERLRVMETKPDGSVMELAEFEALTKLGNLLTKVWERESKLLGLDAPEKYENVKQGATSTLTQLRDRLRKRKEGK